MSKTGSAIYGSGQLLPIFTGAHELVGDYEKGYMILKTSGTLTLFPRTFDFFLVGGGASGYSQPAGYYTKGVKGGSSGLTTTQSDVSISAVTTAVITIGAGGVAPTDGSQASTLGGNSSIAVSGGSTYTANGGTGLAGGSGGGGGANSAATPSGAGGTNGSNGLGTAPVGTGQGTTTRPFGGDVSPFDALQVAGGGGGGGGNVDGYAMVGGSGGAGGGGAGGSMLGSIGPYTDATDGEANTGSGGGGAVTHDSINKIGGNGGSGVMIVRWGY